MASIADMLGVQWGEPEKREYRLTHHAVRTAKQKGFDLDHVRLAANEPHHTYASGRYPGQKRHVRNGLVAVVDPAKREVVTIYEDQRQTVLRPDQKSDPEAVAWDKARKNHG
jgi:Cu2+-containing amine oxidase